MGASNDLDTIGIVKAVGGSHDDILGEDGATAKVPAVNVKGNNEGVLMRCGFLSSNNPVEGLLGGNSVRMEKLGVEDNPVLQPWPW